MKNLNNLQIAYLGGGSKEWARVFMADLALAGDIGGTIRLYDINQNETKKNAIIGNKISSQATAISYFKYEVYDDLDLTLSNVDFVIISILPGTFKEMASDVHLPNEYGIIQSVGDTCGPGGIMRALRTVPIFMDFAKAIEKNCPKAWVLNLTNPMSICVKTLYDTFPKIKAIGCCHEVFNAQDFLISILKEIYHLENIKRQDLFTNVIGINHFTWINEAKYRQIDIIKALPHFLDLYYLVGYNAVGETDAYLTNPFKCANRVKMDLYLKYGILGAAGDRHLAEFMPKKMYLENEQIVNQWKFALTSVNFRIKRQKERVEKTEELINQKTIPLEKSREEVVEMMKALLGLNELITNVNLPNYGQIKNFPLGAIVETNAIFKADSVKPVYSGKLPESIENYVISCSNVHDSLFNEIKNKNLLGVYHIFKNWHLMCDLSDNQCRELFKKMVFNTKDYLEPYFSLLPLNTL